MSGLGNSYHGYQKVNGSCNSYYGNQECCYREPCKKIMVQRKVKKMQSSVEEAFQKEKQCKYEEEQRAKKG